MYQRKRTFGNTLKSFAEEFQPVKAGDLLNKQFDSPKWTVDKLVPGEGITIISAPPKSFKSWIALHFAICIAQGKDAFGVFPCQKTGVLIIDEENHLRFIKERLEKLSAPSDLPILFASQKNFSASDEDCVKVTTKYCKENNIGVVILDSLVRIHEADENNAVEIAKVFANIRSFCTKGITVIILHHERKEYPGTKTNPQARMRGSSDISASVDSHIAIRKTDEERKIIIEPAQLRCDSLHQPFVVYTTSEDGNDFIFQFQGASDRTQKEKATIAIQILLKDHPKGLSNGEIAQGLYDKYMIGMKSVRSAIKKLLEEGILEQVPGRGNEKIVSLKKLK